MAWLPVLLRETLPVKTLALSVRVMPPLPASMRLLPATFSGPVWVMAPLPVRFRSPLRASG